MNTLDTKTKIIKIINDYILNINGKFEGQRLKEKWFKDRNIYSEWKLLSENDIIDAKSYYDYLFNGEDKCDCGESKRFKTFNDGYMPFCPKCAIKEKYKNSDSKTEGIIISKEELKKQLNECIDINYNFSSSKLRSKKLYKSIIFYTNYIPEDRKLSERIYHILNDLKEIPKCNNCNCELDTFISNVQGYASNLCKINNCAMNISHESRKGTISLKSQKVFYNRHVEKYSILIEKDYIFKMFSFEEYLISGYDSIIEITHSKCGYNYELKGSYQGHVKCPKCFPIRSRSQYDVLEYLKTLTNDEIRFNDRKLLAPKELDILIPENFAIEYDSINYHSTGYHKLQHLNSNFENKNIHLDKTEKCEANGIQLFRIFSNEWLIEHKRKIWESILSSKLNCTSRVFARKCTIKEISQNESDMFLEQNHLQGKAINSIRIGLFLEDKLLSVMTFSKSRYNKNYEWELIRFSTLLNFTVIGGASKLLKYFERNYNPKSLISYANRRWSMGNVYSKLGFDFKGDTKPNYFYFKYGDDRNPLLSRIQFQKYKLKEKLEFFDENLSESENMYKNKYRKIYDCGNKIFVKVY